MSRNRAVESFLRARSHRPTWAGVPAEDRPPNVENAYALQAAIHDALGGPVGYKVGSTSPAGQRSFGLDEPILAGLFEQDRAATLRDGLSGELIAPSVECEIAFVVDVDAGDPLGVRIASCHAACEIIDNRYGDPLAVGVPTLLADDFFHARFVLGPPNLAWRNLDLTRLDAVVEVDGTSYRANAAEVLSATASLRWLVARLARSGRRLRSGEIVLTGSIVPPVPITRPPASLALRIEGFEPLVL